MEVLQAPSVHAGHLPKSGRERRRLEPLPTKRLRTEQPQQQQREAQQSQPTKIFFEKVKAEMETLSAELKRQQESNAELKIQLQANMNAEIKSLSSEMKLTNVELEEKLNTLSTELRREQQSNMGMKTQLTEQHQELKRVWSRELELERAVEVGKAELDIKLAEMEDQRMMFEAGELLCACDLLENLTVKLSYALQRIIAKELRFSRWESRVEYFTAFPKGYTIIKLTYPALLSHLLELQNKIPEQYIAEEQLGQRKQHTMKDTGVETAEHRVLRLLHLAEVRVGKELGVPVIGVRLTAGIHALFLKPDRNKAAHSIQLHPPVYQREWQLSPEKDADPASPEVISLLLSEHRPDNRAPGSVSSLVMLLGKVVWRLEKIVGTWCYSNLDMRVVDALTGAVVDRFGKLAGSRFAGFLRDNGVCPKSIRGLACDCFGDGSWRIFMEEDPRYYMFLTSRGEWIDENRKRVPIPFGGWPLQLT